MTCADFTQEERAKMVVYADNALEKDAPAASDLAHQEVAGICRQASYSLQHSGSPLLQPR